MAKFVRPADAYRARHRSPADAYRAKYRDAGSICALADLRVEDDGVARASLAGLPDDLWRRICAFARPATSALSLIVAAGRSASLRNALRAEVEQTEKRLYRMTRSEAAYTLCMAIEDFPAVPSKLGEYTLSMMNEAFLRTITGELFLLHYGEPLMVAKAFLAYGVDPNYARRADGKTALHLTPELASQGFDEAEGLALLLIECGADVHATCHRGCTPLVYAFSSLQLLAMLLAPRANGVGTPFFRMMVQRSFAREESEDRRAATFCAYVAAVIMEESMAAQCRSLRRAHPRLYRDFDSRFDLVQAWIQSQENTFMSGRGYKRREERLVNRGYTESFCDITGRYLRLMSTGVPEFDALMIQLHCWMKVLTQVGLKREAVGEPEGGERALTDSSFKRIMFLAQDSIREIVQKGW